MIRVTAALLVMLVGPGLCFAASATESNTEGKAAYERGDFATAERLFGEAVSAAPNEPVYHYHRGATLVRLGRFADARASYQRALGLHPPATLATTIQTALRDLGPQPPGASTSVGNTNAVRLESSRGVWFAWAVVNHIRNVRFMVDTGATYSTISPALAEALGVVIPRSAPVLNVMALNGPTRGRLVHLTSIRLGDAESTEVPTSVQALPPGLEGILGNSFLGRFAVTLDAHNHLLYLRTR